MNENDMNNDNDEPLISDQELEITTTVQSDDSNEEEATIESSDNEDHVEEEKEELLDTTVTSNGEQVSALSIWNLPQNNCFIIYKYILHTQYLVECKICVFGTKRQDVTI